MREIIVKDSQLSQAAMEGMDAFLQVFIDAIRNNIGGEPTAETMGELNADQMTLLCWDTLHREVMDGGFVQLIHNGYGPFIFKNPFAKALNKMWHMRELSKNSTRCTHCGSKIKRNLRETAPMKSLWRYSSVSRSLTTTTTGLWKMRKTSPNR